VSSRLAETMARTTGFPADGIRVIRNGVDLSRFTSADRTEARRLLNLAPGEIAIGTAGRLVPVKDQALLLQALAILARRGAQFTGVIAGDGPLRAQLESQAAALGIAARVKFLGHRPDVERVYAALDLFVLSSKSEGLSNTILEAMASGRPVVATRVGGADELIEEDTTGVTVPPSRPEDLAAAIERFLRDPALLASMGAAARERALTRFALERMVREYTSVYCELGGIASPAAPERAIEKGAVQCLPHS
jgi:glycosyltransferase involved in cell wall biosynthesis